MRALIPIYVILSFGQVSLASSEEATDQATAVTSESSLKFGAEARAERIWSDEGFSDIGDDEAPTAADIALTKLRLILSGQVFPNVQYALKFDLLETKEKTVQYGYVTYTANIAEQKVSFFLGKMKVHQGGWDQKINAVGDHVQGTYKRQFAFSSYEPMFATSLTLYGKLTLQLVNDISTENKGQWNHNEHLTPIVSWYGELGAFDPVLAYGSYDNNKSYWIDLGLAAETGPLRGRFDAKYDSYSNKVRESGAVKDYADKTTSLSMKIEYEVPELVRPWIYVSKFERQQYESKVANKNDAKVNASTVNANGTFVYALDDNALTIGAGIDGLNFGKNWTPFAAWTTTLATFADPVDAAASERKTLSTFHLGCYAEI